jgi:hypothetical protein
MKILNPVGTARKTEKKALPVTASLDGRRLGILTNHWKSMDRMAQRMAERARTRYGASAVSLYDIPVNGAMAEATERRVLDECDAAIVGLAN